MPITGGGILPAQGVLSYNGVVFDCLYKSHVSMKNVQDNAKRTIKYVEYTLTVDALVTLAGIQPGQLAPEFSIDRRMKQIMILLSQQGGMLTYSGKGLSNLVVNPPTGGVIGLLLQFVPSDIAWGPVPQILEFIPLGTDSDGAQGASIKWTVTFCLFVQNVKGPLVQFNYDLSVAYDDQGYSSLQIRGTMEIPLRRLTVDKRSLNLTIDDYREKFIGPLFSDIDTTRFRITRRQFDTSRDRRTVEFSLVAEELPPMPLPPGMMNARGTMSVRTMNRNAALMLYIVSLKCTYTVRRDQDRRLAWAEFFTLWKFRMDNCSGLAVEPLIDDEGGGGDFNINNRAGGILKSVAEAVTAGANGATLQEVKQKQLKVLEDKGGLGTKAMPMDFGFDEGLYLDSKEITFHATWSLICTFQSVLVGSGLWRYDHLGTAQQAFNDWRLAMYDVNGWASWMRNRVDPAADVIVDLGWEPGTVSTLK